jgi:hypothetical protein
VVSESELLGGPMMNFAPGRVGEGSALDCWLLLSEDWLGSSDNLARRASF